MRRVRAQWRHAVPWSRAELPVDVSDAHGADRDGANCIQPDEHPCRAAGRHQLPSVWFPRFAGQLSVTVVRHHRRVDERADPHLPVGLKRMDQRRVSLPPYLSVVQGYGEPARHSATAVSVCGTVGQGATAPTSAVAAHVYRMPLSIGSRAFECRRLQMEACSAPLTVRESGACCAPPTVDSPSCQALAQELAP